MHLGIHASVRKGVLNALERAAELKCRSVQIFPPRLGNPTPWPSKSYVDQTLSFRKKNRIAYLAVHSIYQPNIASTNEKTRIRSRNSFLEEYRYTHAIGADCLVIHPGSYSPESSLSEGLHNSAETVRWVLSQVASESLILIENVSGGERRMGGTFEEIKDLMDRIGSSDRIGICLDTAHTFSSGVPIQTRTGLDSCLSAFDRRIGLKKIRLFHLNDSASDSGSHKDIHQHIGEGKIGLESLKTLATDKRFDSIPGILETPRDTENSDEINLARLRS